MKKDDNVDVVEDEVEVDDFEHDEVEEMLRRKTAPKTRTHTLCKPAQSRCTWTFHYVREITNRTPQTKTANHTLREPAQSRCTWTFHYVRENKQIKCHRPRPPTTLCASLRSRNALGRFTKANSRKNLQEKCRRPRSRPTLCASLRSRNVLGRFTKDISSENLQEKCRGPRSPKCTICM